MKNKHLIFMELFLFFFFFFFAMEANPIDRKYKLYIIFDWNKSSHRFSLGDNLIHDFGSQVTDICDIYTHDKK